MYHIFKMAYRNLGRNRRRSFFSSLSIGIGLALLLFIAAFIEGEIRQATDMTIELQSGHIQVRASSYDEAKSSLAWEDLVENPQQIAAQIASLGPVIAATPRLFANGIVYSGNLTQGVRIIGIEPLSSANEPYKKGLVSGEFLSADDREGILIGSTLAELLAIGTGDRVNLLVNTSNGEVDEQTFTIRGVYATGSSGYDEATVFMVLEKAQAITQTENRASTIFVLLEDREQTAAVVTALYTEYDVQTWEDMNVLLLQTEQMTNGVVNLIYLIVLAITSTVVINTLLMSVFERTREIGILSAIGMRGGRIMGLFFAESGLLAMGGIVMGLVMGILLNAYFKKCGIFLGDMGISGMLFGDRIYNYPTLKDAVSLTILTFVITLLSALYPARMEPVEVLHSGQ